MRRELVKSYPGVIAITVAFSLMLAFFGLLLSGPSLVGTPFFTANPLLLSILAGVLFSSVAILFINSSFSKRLFDVDASPSSPNADEIRIRLLEGEIEKLNAEMALDISTEKRTKIEERAFQEVLKQSSQGVIQALDIKYAAEMKNDLHLKGVLAKLNAVEAQLSRERSVVSTRSFFNLFVGIMLGIFGVWVLYQTLNSIGEGSVALLDQTLYFVSRFLLAVLVQFLAYFFLALYRNGLQEVKFYRNEITNINMMHVGIQMAWAKGDDLVISQIITRLINTERNFILKKGETTAGILQHSFETEATAPALSASDLSKVTEGLADLMKAETKDSKPV